MVSHLAREAKGIELPVALVVRVPELLKRYRDGSGEVFKRMRDRLHATGRYPKMKDLTPNPYGPGLHLCRTVDLLGKEVNTKTAVDAYKQVLNDALEAFLQSGPDGPMRQLLSEAHG